MDWLGDHLWTLWLGICIVLLIGELLSLDLFLLMLAFGAGAGALSTFATDVWQVQLGVSLVVAVACLLLVRPNLVRRLHTSPGVAVGPERMIGVRAIAPDGIAPHATVQLKIDGELWATSLAPGTPAVEPGAVVQVQAISGATAIVVPVQS